MPYTDEYIRKIESIQKQCLLFALRHQYNPNDYMNLPSYDIRLNEWMKICLLTLCPSWGIRVPIFVWTPLIWKLSNPEEIIDQPFLYLICILNGNINSEELKNHEKLNNNRTTRISKYLHETNHTSNYGHNNSLSRGNRIFKIRV
jgi:hypothetical protein